MNDRFLSLFFEEAQELLQALEAGLMDLELRQGDREHLDRTFRAAHTLKGAAGMVGLRPIAEFTHKVEAVLDDIRSGRMAVTREAITILLRAKDHLGAALDAATGGRTTEAPADLEEALVGLEGGADRSFARTRARARAGCTGGLPASAADLSPERRTAPRTVRAGREVSRRYRIDFRPRPDLLRKGIDPLGFLDELRELGSARVTAHVDAVPPLEDLTPTDCLLAWTVDLLTDVGRAQLEEVFLFLDEPGQVTIVEVDEPLDAPAPPIATLKVPAPSPPAEPPRPKLALRRPGCGSMPSSSTTWWAWRVSLRCSPTAFRGWPTWWARVRLPGRSRPWNGSAGGSATRPWNFGWCRSRSCSSASRASSATSARRRASRSTSAWRGRRRSWTARSSSGWPTR